MDDDLYILKTSGLSSEDFGEELVAVNFETGQYYGINGSAVAIWTLLHKPVSRTEIADQLKAIFRSVPADIVEDIDAFLKELKSYNLLVIGAKDVLAELQSKASPEVLQRLAGAPYVPPSIEVYSDLQELIMLDPVHEADPEKGWPLRREDPTAGKPGDSET